MDLEQLVELFPMLIGVGAIGAIGILSKFMIDGIVSFFKLEDYEHKRWIVVIVPIILYVLYLFRDTSVVQFLMGGLAVVASTLVSVGVKSNKPKEEVLIEVESDIPKIMSVDVDEGESVDVIEINDDIDAQGIE